MTVVFTIRTWAATGRNRRIGIFLVAFFVAIWVANFVLAVRWIPTIICTCFLLNHFVWPPLTAYIATPIPVPTQVISSGCYNVIRSSARSINYILILPFYVGQFLACSLEFVYVAHRHRLVTLSLMAFQAYKHCESRCSDRCHNFFLTITNTVVGRASYNDFVRLVFLDGGFPLLAQ